VRSELSKNIAIVAGAGLHSKCEALSIYYAGIPGPDGLRTLKNTSLELTRSVHWVTGIEISLPSDITLRLETYYQNLYNVPVVNKLNSRYSVLNISQGVPENQLENSGRGRNKGVELTLEKAFTHNYYFLLTTSLFDSEYFSGDKVWHPTYYNNKYIINFLGGRDFYVGKKKQNTVGINFKCISRGGYRYTPVDIGRSLEEKRVVTIGSESYSQSLPDFFRLDGGLSFRKNNLRNSWIVMVDIQNITDRANVFRKRFVYADGKITSYYINSLGIVPVFNFRIEFQSRRLNQ